ncbi:MAG: ribose 5-phosphate isomerase B, partial [Candidatus Omnitrophica bacterium]|nr:ribose 5-phosphate isomerase B [Candidatus Omnitrophota bacterium]
MDGAKTIAIGADHGGYALKEEIKEFLKKQNIQTIDFGTNSSESCDYPDFGYEVGKAVKEKKAEIGIVICKSGFGMCIVANKVKGVRCAVCDNVEQAVSAREHNFCNVLSLGANRVGVAKAKKIIKVFINTPFGEERHQKRVAKI